MTGGTDHAAPARGNARAYALLIFTTLCWGGNAVFGKLAVGEISPMALVTARWLGASLLLWGQVPSPMPIHWNATGVADGFGPRWLGLTIMPAIGVGLTVLVEKLGRPQMTSEGSHRALTTIVGGTAAFMAGVHGLMLQASITGANLSQSLMLVLLGGLFAALGVVLPQLNQNRVAGVRTPWSLADATNWTLTHRFARGSLLLAGTASALAGLLLSAPASVIVALGAVVVGSLAPVVFSYAVHVVQQRR